MVCVWLWFSFSEIYTRASTRQDGDFYAMSKFLSLSSSPLPVPSYFFFSSSVKDSVSSSNSTWINLFFCVFAEWFKVHSKVNFFSDNACLLQLRRSAKGKSTNCWKPFESHSFSSFRKRVAYCLKQEIFLWSTWWEAISTYMFWGVNLRSQAILDCLDGPLLWSLIGDTFFKNVNSILSSLKSYFKSPSVGFCNSPVA